MSLKLAKVMALSMVLASVSAGCTSRTILHGLKDGTPPPSSGSRVNVYFVKANQEGLSLVPVKRTLSSSDRLQESVRALLAGPSESEAGQGLGSEIPRGTILLGVKRKGADVELNLSRRFASGGGVQSLETRLEQLRRTVAGVESWRNVYLSVEGSRLTIAAGEGIEVRQPINR